MKKVVLVKIDCHLERKLDKELMNEFFEKMKEYLKIDNKLPEKNNSPLKVKKI